VKDTWAARDLPVLDATVALLDEPERFAATVTDIAAATGIDPVKVARGLDTLIGAYSDLRTHWTGDDPGPWYAQSVPPAARRAAGNRPTPESLIARLADSFKAAAEHEKDPKQQKRLRKVASTLGGPGHDLALEVAAEAIADRSGLD